MFDLRNHIETAGRSQGYIGARPSSISVTEVFSEDNKGTISDIRGILRDSALLFRLGFLLTE